MSYTKVTDEDRLNKGVTGLPDVPQLSTEDMQQKFDELGNMGIDALNNLVDELEAPTGADSLGATVPSGLVANPNVGSILSAIYALYGLLQDDAHTHSNKATLDEISSIIKSGYDRLVAIFQNVDSVNNGVLDDSGSIPTGHAIVNYVSQLGGGDMLKAVYDHNNSGVVDDADAVQGHTVTTSPGAITNPTTETGAQIPTANAVNSVYRGLLSAVNSKIPFGAIRNSLSSEIDTVPSSRLVKNISDGLTGRIESLDRYALQMTDNFLVRSESASTYDTHDVDMFPGHLYIFFSTTHKNASGDSNFPGAISGTIGVTLRYMDSYYNGTDWKESIVVKDIITPSNFALTSDVANRKVIAKATTGYQAACTVVDMLIY